MLTRELSLAGTGPAKVGSSHPHAGRSAWGSGAALALVAVTICSCGGGRGGGAASVGGLTADAGLENASDDGAGGAAPGETSTDAAAGLSDAVPERPPPPQPYPRPGYQLLSETGLFSDLGSRTVTADAVLFEPTYKLWSDGASKRRWMVLPPGTQIDTGDMDHWVFPVGTKFFKEFSLDGVTLETRLVERYGTGPEDYWMGAFVWRADQSDAVFVKDGQLDINGTMHDAPSQKNCGSCHRGDVGRILGFSAIQMSGATTGPNLRQLGAMDLLTVAGDDAGYPVPGDPQTAQALGYLHANCGHCHNENGTAWPDTQMVLRLVVADHDVATSGIYQSIVAQKLEYWRGGAITVRVAPGSPDDSAIVARMAMRGSDNQMPPLATEIVDPTGLELVRAWIASLPP